MYCLYNVSGHEAARRAAFEAALKGDAVPDEADHIYTLLVPTGLERIALAALPLPSSASAVLAEPVVIPRGQSPGAFTSIMVTSHDGGILQESTYAHPCVTAALASVLVVDLDADQVDSCTSIASLLLSNPSLLDRAVTTREAHTPLSAGSTAATYRVATSRSGEHGFSSRELDGALGEVIGQLRPEWSVSLDEPSVFFCGLLSHWRLTLGILLPPFEARKSDVLPFEPRQWLSQGRSRPHTRPSRAHLLARLAAPTAHEVRVCVPLARPRAAC